jgi:DNA-binding response OmpR family regulator
MKILIVEDEKGLAESISSHLSKEAFICEIVYNLESAIEKINLYAYDCAIIDLNLPDGEGFNAIDALRKISSSTGIIIISARHSLEDKIKGLEIGSDDYLTKPFHLSELIARVKSLIRRRNFGGNNEISFNEIKINFKARQIFIANNEINLTRKELDLLLYLITNRGTVLTKASIAEHLWGDNMDNAESFDLVYSQVKNLRRKLTESGCKDYIQSIYGIGYKFGES